MILEYIQVLHKLVEKLFQKLKNETIIEDYPIKIDNEKIDLN